MKQWEKIENKHVAQHNLFWISEIFNPLKMIYNEE